MPSLPAIASPHPARTKCPDCQSTLTPKRVDSIEIDPCGDCGGTWFDAGEFECIGQRAAGFDAGPFLGRGLPAGPCPRCVDATLLGGQMTVHSVARCSACQGVWVPRGIRTAEEKRRMVDSLESILGALEIALGVLEIFF